VRDRLPAHRSRLVQDFIAELQGWISTAYLPPYAPELNPVEYIWGYWKQHELPNVCPKDYWQLSEAARRTLHRMRRRPRLISGFQSFQDDHSKKNRSADPPASSLGPSLTVLCSTSAVFFQASLSVAPSIQPSNNRNLARMPRFATNGHSYKLANIHSTHARGIQIHLS
jgi:DDE superfamily endonuclease